MDWWLGEIVGDLACVAVFVLALVGLAYIAHKFFCFFWPETPTDKNSVDGDWPWGDL